MTNLFNLAQVVEKQVENAQNGIGPVTQVTQLKVSTADVEQLKRAWEADALLLKEQSGCISVQLHSSFEEGCFLSYIVWQSIKHFLAAKTFVQAHNTHGVAKPYPRWTESSTQLIQIVPIGGGAICRGSRTFNADCRSPSDKMNTERSAYAINVTAAGGTKLTEPPVHDHWIQFDITSSSVPQATNLPVTFMLSREDSLALGVWLAEKTARQY